MRLRRDVGWEANLPTHSVLLLLKRRKFLLLELLLGRGEAKHRVLLLVLMLGLVGEAAALRIVRTGAVRVGCHGRGCRGMLPQPYTRGRGGGAGGGRGSEPRAARRARLQRTYLLLLHLM